MTSSAVFSMFGGGAKKEKKEEEDRGDTSGSAKAQREAAAAASGDKKEKDDVRLFPLPPSTPYITVPSPPNTGQPGQLTYPAG